MKLLKSQLKQLLKEEIDSTLNEFGGLAQNLGASGGRPPSPPVEQPLSNASPFQGTEAAPLKDEPDTIIQGKALQLLMSLGLSEKECLVMVKNIAISDLVAVIEKIPKIDTAAEDLDEAKTRVTIGGPGGVTITPPSIGEAEKVAADKLAESMGLIEKAMLYMYSDGKEGRCPIKTASLIRNLLAEISEEGS